MDNSESNLTVNDIMTTEIGENNEDQIDSMDEGELNAPLSEKIRLEKSDRSLSEFVRWFKSGRLIVNPEWQRNYVWDRKQASRLIESFLLDIPVPVVYLAKTEEGKYEVIDGLQRLTSIFTFFDNDLSLNGLDILTDLNRKTFNDLDESLQHKLEDTTLRSFELSSDTNKDIHFVVFERLNTGGTKLNDMEIRNCLFRGPLNDLIKDLSENNDFLSCINQKSLSKRMNDRALILRFLTFYERTHKRCKSGLKKFQNEFLETYQNAPKPKIDEYRRAFEKSMKACVTVFGNHAFRLKSDVDLNSKSKGEWATRINAAIFQVIAPSFTEYDIGQITRKSDLIYEEYLDLINTDEAWVDRVRRATGEWSRLSYVFESWQERLSNVMAGAEPNDSIRIFSRKLKEELFQQDNTCALCNQKISLIDDSVLDHELHYWRGGKTIPENARLAHRFCNSSRGGR